MPTYQYRCLNCKRRFEVYLSYSEYEQKIVTCTHCASPNVQRRIGRIRFARSEDSRLDDLADPSSLEGLEDEPARPGREHDAQDGAGDGRGDAGPEFDEVVNRLEAGQSPEDIEEAMPDLAGDARAGMDDDF